MRNRKYCFIDFEYNNSKEKYLNLVSCSFWLNTAGIESFWLLNDYYEKQILKARLNQLKKEGFIFVAFNVVAEASSFISLRLNPREFDWIDLQAEWKMLINQNNELAYKQQLINGKEVFTFPPPIYSQTEVDHQSHAKAETNLAAMTYKLLNKKIDTDHKDMMRNIIIEGKDISITQHRDAILKYNESDIKYMPELWEIVKATYQNSILEQSPYGQVKFMEVLARGLTGANIAIITSHGYPIDKDQVQCFASQVPSILHSCCADINSQFPKNKFFELNPKTNSYVFKQKAVNNWIATLPKPQQENWLKTEKGGLSHALEAFTKYFDFKHDYPRDNVGAQIVRFLKLKQSLNGFMPKTKGATFFDSVGSDSRVRAYFNPYGSQTSRFQPKATSFIPLKAAWMRSLIRPRPGFMIANIDYCSEEFLISAVLSGDKNMLDAYKSGDVYLHFAKLAGAVPMDGTKEKYKKERDKFKSTTLGISYQIGAESLANKLTLDTGEFHTTDQAQELINTFFDVFKDYHNFIETEQHEYIFRQFSKLADGWVMFGDNPNRRSVANFPVQGMGAVILRNAIDLLLHHEFKVIYPLHDAIAIECADFQFYSIDLFHDLMHEAFYKSFTTEKQQHDAKAIRLDINAWGNGLEEGIGLTHNQRKYKSQKIYIDERAVNEYTYFKKYLN